MTAVHAFEDLYGVEIDPEVRALRRLLYAGEWIQSHALHVYLLHAPDFLGYPSALAMAADHRAVVERGLRLKKLGNAIMTLIGGRAIHPVSVRIGGFSKAPKRAPLEALRSDLDQAIEDAKATIDMAASFPTPVHDRETHLVSLRHPTDYPFSEGRIVSTEGLDIAAGAWDEAFHEEHLEGTNALHARTADGRTYLLGPAARITLAGDQLHPLAAEALARTGLRDEIRTNIYRSIVARAVELLSACGEARDIIDRYRPPSEPKVAHRPRAGRASWSTEAPRGLIFHRYEVDERGFVTEAQIVPPTSQNQGSIEADLRGFAPSVLAMSHAEATLRLEQLIRSYDPCISCATHFLDLRIEQA
jgi:coenzyme F420-reducing hydrogenase alpha subunit